MKIHKKLRKWCKHESPHNYVKMMYKWWTNDGNMMWKMMLRLCKKGVHNINKNIWNTKWNTILKKMLYNNLKISLAPLSTKL